MESRDPLRVKNQLVGVGFAALAASGLVVATAGGASSPLGAPGYWPWLLTGLQVFALSSAGRGRDWGWLVGGAVQLPWIAYAVVTTQFGFIPGCAISTAVQIGSFLRRASMASGRSRPVTSTGRAMKEAI